MKKELISMMAFLLLSGFSQPVLAQVNEAVQQNQTGAREIPSPENRARQTSKQVKKLFDLTEDQYNKVYKLYLQQEKDRESGTSMPGGMGGPGGMPGGMGGPGGMPGGGMGGPGGMSGGMGGPGGGMPGGGMGPGGMSGMNFNSSSAKPADKEKMMKQMQAQREKQHQKLAKKMKKILSADQFNRWDEWEQKQMQEPKGPEPVEKTEKQ